MPRRPKGTPKPAPKTAARMSRKAALTPTQLEKLDWSGKKVLPLTTHEGSGLAGCERDLKKTCKGAKVGKGLAVHGADAAKSRKAVADWAKKSIG